MKNVFLHADLDAFFASVELLDHPEWKNKPVIVGGKPEDRRSVVSTASYEARKYGVHSAMPVFQAYRLCPQGIYVHPRMERYLELSEKIMNIFKNYSPDVQQISIDEAFIDLTGTERLFGPPEETGKKIKQEVFEKTGLTVSVGIASTKYLAKISSEIKKPDGLFVVKDGEEVDFMMKLPLEKLWGVGSKTLEVIKSRGINTTKSIYDKPLPLLVNLFGQSTGAFLFNAVRGLEKDTFNHKPKSHSISAENTYPFDLTDSFAIETALLELSHTVVFRLRREHLRSSNVMLKIRYDDFSTFTVQEASDRNITSVDDMFERIKKLFYKKFDSRHTIRLLGAGVYNTESENAPFQAELFDFGEEKKQKVEAAILKSEVKIPGVKITKARLLNTTKKLVILFATLFFFLQPSESKAQTLTETSRDADGAGSLVFNQKKLPQTFNDGEALFSYNIFDKNVDFSAEGYWQTSITGGGALSYGNNNAPGYTITTPVFRNQIDLSLWFFLNKTWFFEAAFADDFDTTTFAAGYKGQGILKEVRAANRGINFPSLYSIDFMNRGIGGGENLSPGIFVHLQDENWISHFVVRYDMLETRTKTWYGKNTVTTTELELSDYVTGMHFVLPDSEGIMKTKAVYVEASDGTYTDSSKRRYKKLDSTQYLLNGHDNSIYLSKDSRSSRKDGLLPAIIIEFYDNWDLEAAAGDWNDSSSFSGAVNEIFEEDLKAWSIPFSTEINGKKAYYLQYPSRFSPFAVLNRYDAGILSSGEASLTDKSTGIVSSLATVILADNDFEFSTEDFFSTNHRYADLFLEGSYSPLDPEYRFPLSKIDSGAYLSFNLKSNLSLSIRTYTPVSRFEISTKAVPGTVKVYRNGIPDSTAVYDSSTGLINLTSSVSPSDRISAIWSEDSSDTDSGQIAAAAGWKKQFTPQMALDLSFASRWSYLPQDFKDAKKISTPGFVTLSTGFEYEGKRFFVKNGAAFSVESDNTRGNCIISSMDETESDTIYLSKNSSVKNKNNFIPKLNSRDYSSFQLLEETKNGSLSPSEGKSDSSISGWAIPVSFDFSDLDEPASEASPFWASTTIRLPAAAVLASASEFSFALKNPSPELSDALRDAKIRIYLQLGVNGDETYRIEDSEFIPTWLISSWDGSKSPDVKSAFLPDQTDMEKGNWQTVTVKISDKDKAMLQSAHDMRLVVTAESKIKGEFLAGPYEISASDFSVTAENNSLFFENTQRLSKNNRCKTFDFLNETPETFTITKYFEEFSLENYEKLTLKIKYDSSIPSSDDYMTVSFERIEKNGNPKTAVKYTLSSEQLNQIRDQGWINLQVDLKNKKVNWGNLEKINLKTVPELLKIQLHTSDKTSLSIDEVSLNGSRPYIVLQDKTKAGWNYTGTLISLNHIPVLHDSSVSLETDAGTAFRENSADNKPVFISGHAKAETGIWNLKLSAEAGRNSDSNIALPQASHQIYSAKPVFGILNFSENYSFDNDENSLDKLNSISLNFAPLLPVIPLTLKSDNQASYTPWSVSQKSRIEGALNYRFIKTTLSSDFSQSLNGTDNAKVNYSTVNYVWGWKDITELAFSSGNEDSTTRKVSYKLNLAGNLDFANFRPEYKFSAEENYKNGNSTVYSDKTVQMFALPFSLSKHSIRFMWEKSSGGVKKTESGGSYIKDTQELSESLSERKWYLTSLPVADLFSSGLRKQVLKDSSMTAKSMESLFYSSSYSASWNRPFSGTFRDFYLPSQTLFAVERDIRTASSVSDQYQFKTTVSYNSVNIFGAKGVKKLTDLFETDEYMSSITASVKLPAVTLSTPRLSVNGYQQSTFYLTESATIKTGVDFTYEDKNNLKGKGTVIYRRPSSGSLLKEAVALIYKSEDFTSSRITKTDSFNASYSRASSSSSNSRSVSEKLVLDYCHEVDLKLTDYTTLNASGSLNYDMTVNKINILTAALSIGATVRF